MSIADSWRRDRGISSVPVRKPVTQKDQIMRRVIEGFPEEDAEQAAEAYHAMVGHETKVSFRRTIEIPKVPSGDDVDLSKVVFDNLKSDHTVGRRSRGRVVLSLTDGRDVVRLEDGSNVVAMIGKDCVRLRWWHRLFDWMFGRSR